MRAIVRAGLVAMAAVDGLVGVWATFAPRSFFDAFPGFGRTWVANLPPYNEHLVRDVGGLNLVVAALFVVAAVRLEPVLVRALLLASLLWAVPHLIFHIGHLGGLDAVDVVAQVALLALAVAGPLVLAPLAGRLGANDRPTGLAGGR